ncbi:MAG: hypothetical protein RIQ71_22 [Verrucomicrobiota bacterium]|jgi:hypothetical protein
MARTAKLILLSLAVCTAGGHAGPLADKVAAAESRQEFFVEGADGRRFLPADLRFVDKLASPDIASLVSPAVAAISNFASQLKDAGISLAVLPVPPKSLVQSSSLGVGPEEQAAMTAGWEKIMAEIGAHGVPVVDLLPEYSAAREEVFCLRDTHWSGRGIDAALPPILRMATTAGIAVNSAPEAALKDVEISGDLGGSPEKVQLRFPSLPTAVQDPQLLLLGDSHVLVFHQGGDLHGTGAGLPEQLAAALGFMPEVLGVRGSGATSSRMQLARRVKAKPEYLSGTKMIVWIFAGREFTEADTWKKISVSPRKQDF